jgi:pimeloyl-ACP methyl ester carboxylesterase
VPEAPSGDLRIYYERLGSGPPLVIVNGIGEQIGGVGIPDELVQAIAARGVEVIRLDNRDIGLSGKVEAAGAPDLEAVAQAFAAGDEIDAPYLLHEMADDVIAVLDDAGIERAHLAGMSMGGFICRWAAIRHPDRVASLTLITTGSGADDGDPAPAPDPAVVERFVDYVQPREGDEEIKYKVEFWRWLWGEGGRYPFDADLVRTRMTAAYERAHDPEGVQRQLVAIVGTPGLFQAQREIACPTLILHGSHDPVFPTDHGEAMAASIPNPELWLVDRLGHCIPEQIWPQLTDRLARQVAAR